MTTTFETAQPGDRVWSPMFGWGSICARNDLGFVQVVPDSNATHIWHFDFKGNHYGFGVGQLLFWSERTWADPAPQKPVKRPVLAVDTKIWVSGYDSGPWFPVHFSHWPESPKSAGVFCWWGGATSHSCTQGVCHWNYYSLTNPDLEKSNG